MKQLPRGLRPFEAALGCLQGDAYAGWRPTTRVWAAPASKTTTPHTKQHVEEKQGDFIHVTSHITVVPFFSVKR